MISDIYILESLNGGEFELVNNDLKTTQGFAQMVYLGLFGGNTEASTPETETVVLDERFDWWGNNTFFKNKPAQQFNSTFEALLSKTALNSSGIALLENAAKKDLEFMENFSTIEVEGSLTAPFKFQLDVTIIEPSNKSTKLKFMWDGQKDQVNKGLENPDYEDMPAGGNYIKVSETKRLSAGNNKTIIWK